MKQKCSWVDGHGHRVQGTFIRWIENGQFAETRQLSGGKCRILKANLTFEMG